MDCIFRKSSFRFDFNTIVLLKKKKKSKIGVEMIE